MVGVEGVFRRLSLEQSRAFLLPCVRLPSFPAHPSEPLCIHPKLAHRILRPSSQPMTPSDAVPATLLVPPGSFHVSTSSAAWYAATHSPTQAKGSTIWKM